MVWTGITEVKSAELPEHKIGVRAGAQDPAGMSVPLRSEQGGRAALSLSPLLWEPDHPLAPLPTIPNIYFQDKSATERAAFCLWGPRSVLGWLLFSCINIT